MITIGTQELNFANAPNIFEPLSTAYFTMKSNDILALSCQKVRDVLQMSFLEFKNNS